jgi:hypothetical protein
MRLRNPSNGKRQAMVRRARRRCVQFDKSFETLAQKRVQKHAQKHAW